MAARRENKEGPRRKPTAKRAAKTAAKPAPTEAVASEEAAEDAAEDADEESDPDDLDQEPEPVDAGSEAEVLEAAGEVLTDEGAGASEETGRSGLARMDALQVYMREVQRHPLLSPDEEHSLAVNYSKSGDVTAAARLVTANLRLVVKIAYEYRRAYRNMTDLVQEGNIGLMQAVKRYDPYRGVKLSSYAAWWIRAYMLRFILNNWRLVKIGTTQAQRKLFFNLSKEKAKLSALGIEPTDAEVARRLNVEESEVVEMGRRLSRGDASLDAPVGDSDDRTTTRMELLPATSDSPDRLAENAELGAVLHEKLDEFRKTLTGKDVAIFDKRLVADEPLTLQQLGDEFGVSRERVRQLEARLTGKLREYLKEALGDAVGVS
ncbi:MAG TPA: RNA polymerase factor sigma-32 [Polyangiaceae bacterium]|nr:RNA polymerase factor sigma-32 [Polyangiaceae bacterium]